MTKPCLAFSLLFMIIVSCSRKESVYKVSNCSKVWEGNFYNLHEGKVDNEISRTGNVQTEHYKDGSVGEFKVEWLDSCRYRLTKISGNEISNSKALEAVIVQITEVKKNSYTLEAWIEGSSVGLYKSEMFRRKQ